MFNGNWNGPAGANDRGLLWHWWNGDAVVPGCADEVRDVWQEFYADGNYYEVPGANGRPDQFDWLLAQLENRYDRGYRRIVLMLPAGVVKCQDMPASQWWPMASWRRQWFEAMGSGHSQGVAGWASAHEDVQLAVYTGWQIGDPCSICYEANAATTLCETLLSCQGGAGSWRWFRCPGPYTTHPPSTLVPNDMCTVWQNIQPYRSVGFTRFWIDASSGAAAEFREFVNNPNFLDDLPTKATFGGEAFPTGPQQSNLRYPVIWSEFNYSPWIIDLNWAERACQNGAPCNDLLDTSAHLWDPGLEPVREAAIHFSEWPRCSYTNTVPVNACDANNTPLHPHWDQLKDYPFAPTYYPFQRMKNLYEWYICKGFCFLQSDLDALSGAGERIFGFGQIKPPGDFDGNGLYEPAVDWEAYEDQYDDWNVEDGLLRGCFTAGPQVLTYYHGDMNSDGEVNGADYALAQGWILTTTLHLGADRYFLGEGGNTVTGSHKMTWNPNGLNPQWLPCPCSIGSGPSFGPP